MPVTERTLYPKFNELIRTRSFPTTTVFELKICHTERFRFSDVKPHQIRALQMSSNNGLYHKISDQSQGQKPFDSFLIKGAAAYIVVCFYSKGIYDTYFINIKDWPRLTADQSLKSILKEDLLPFTEFTENL